MPCTVVNSQAQTQARLPSLPSSMPGVPQGAWTSFLQTLNAWAQILQQESHAPNVLPAQFQTFAANAATPVLAAFTAANCTPSIDATTQYYGGASLKVAIAAAGATLSFTGTPISIAAASRWFAAFSVLATGGCTGSLTVKTATTTLTESFDVPAATGWQQVWGLFDLRAIGDTQATWELTFTSTATVWLDGLQMNLVGSPISKLPKFAGTQMVTGGLAYADAVDLATSQVLNKTAINITYTGGATVQSLQPAQAGADVTGQNTAADTSKVNGVASSSISPIANLMPAEAGADVTSQNTAADTSKVNGVASSSISPIATLMPAEAAADVTATHTSNDTANVNAVAAATISQGATRANAAIDSTNVVVSSGVDFSRPYTNKTLTNIPDGGARFAVTNIAGGNAVSYVDSNNRALIDFSQSGHLYKTADYIGAGNNYAIPSYGPEAETVDNGNFVGGSATFVPGWVSGGDASIGIDTTNPTPTSGGTLFVSATAANAYGGASPVRSMIAIPGDVYVFGGYGRSDGQVPAGLDFVFQDASGNNLAETTISYGTNTSWTFQRATTGAAPAATVQAQISCRADLAPAVGDTAWYKGITAFRLRSLDTEVSDGTTYGRFPISHFDDLTNRRVATINGGISPLGSIVTGSSTVTVSYTSTTTSVTISWTAGTLNRMDGTQTNVSSGSVTVTGLTASTTYYAAMYWDEVAQAISFVTGQSGAVGSPAILYPSESPEVAWQGQLQSHLNLGWVPVATPASGGGGGNGSTGCCLRGTQLIELASGAMREAQELTTGDVLTSPAGPTRITQLRFEPWREWHRVEFNDGRVLDLAADHRFVDPSGAQIHVRDLKLHDVVQARDAYLSVARLEVCADVDLKVSIEVQSPHVYYVDGVLSHNKVLC